MSDPFPSPPADPLFEVRNQVTLISGGTRGIGRAIAAGFISRGARVIVTGSQPETVEQAREALPAGDHATDYRVCDVREPEAIKQLVAEVAEQYGRIDTLVNVAGVNRRKPAADVTADDYNFILDTNLRGAFLLSQHVGAVMRTHGGGSQIQIASLNTDRPLKNVLPYAMSKGAMGTMTRGLAIEWGRYGVRVNALAPGFILTDLTEKLWSRPDMQAWNEANCPLGRLGQPDDMVGTAIFLASRASAFLTGQIIYVDGGVTAGTMWPIGDEPSGSVSASSNIPTAIVAPDRPTA